MRFKKLVEAWRGAVVEGVHFGVAAVASADGSLVHAWGDPTVVTYPRSSLKPVQAVGLMESGAHKAFGLTQRHTALACASHRGESIHTDLVQAWLGRIGLDEGALVCGAALPGNQQVAESLLADGGERARRYHNCSGKHCGFLTVSCHMGWDVAGYDDRSHPAQQLYVDVLSELLGQDASALPFGVDGCSLPAAALSMENMAVVLARFAAAQVSSPVRKAAIREIQQAMGAFPELVSGAGQPNTIVSEASRGGIVMKTGAAGYIGAYLPKQELGIALKIADGNAEARVVAFIALLQELGLADAASHEGLAAIAEPPISNSVGTQVGRLCFCGACVSSNAMETTTAT